LKWNYFSFILFIYLFFRYKDLKDPEYKQFKYFFYDFQIEIGPALGLIEFIPITRFFYRKLINKTIKTFEDIKEVLKIKYKDHYKGFKEYIIRDFCDALISAKNEALSEDKESKPYLTDDNLTLVILDLFMGNSSFFYILYRKILYFVI
jgi:hypothetical protein